MRKNFLIGFVMLIVSIPTFAGVVGREKPESGSTGSRSQVFTLFLRK